MDNHFNLKQGIEYKTKVFRKNFVPQTIFIIGGVVLINNSTNSKQKRHTFNSRLIHTQHQLCLRKF